MDSKKCSNNYFHTSENGSIYKNVCNFPTNLMKLHSIELYNVITAKKKEVRVHYRTYTFVNSHIT